MPDINKHLDELGDFIDKAMKDAEKRISEDAKKVDASAEEAVSQVADNVIKHSKNEIDRVKTTLKRNLASGSWKGAEVSLSNLIKIKNDISSDSNFSKQIKKSVDILIKDAQKQINEHAIDFNPNIKVNADSKSLAKATAEYEKQRKISNDLQKQRDGIISQMGQINHEQTEQIKRYKEESDYILNNVIDLKKQAQIENLINDLQQRRSAQGKVYQKDLKDTYNILTKIAKLSSGTFSPARNTGAFTISQSDKAAIEASIKKGVLNEFQAMLSGDTRWNQSIANAVSKAFEDHYTQKGDMKYLKDVLDKKEKWNQNYVTDAVNRMLKEFSDANDTHIISRSVKNIDTSYEDSYAALETHAQDLKRQMGEVEESMWNLHDTISECAKELQANKDAWKLDLNPKEVKAVEAYMSALAKEEKGAFQELAALEAGLVRLSDFKFKNISELSKHLNQASSATSAMLGVLSGQKVNKKADRETALDSLYSSTGIYGSGSEIAVKQIAEQNTQLDSAIDKVKQLIKEYSELESVTETYEQLLKKNQITLTKLQNGKYDYDTAVTKVAQKMGGFLPDLKQKDSDAQIYREFGFDYGSHGYINNEDYFKSEEQIDKAIDKVKESLQGISPIVETIHNNIAKMTGSGLKNIRDYSAALKQLIADGEKAEAAYLYSSFITQFPKQKQFKLQMYPDLYANYDKYLGQGKEKFKTSVENPDFLRENSLKLLINKLETAKSAQGIKERDLNTELEYQRRLAEELKDVDLSSIESRTEALNIYNQKLQDSIRLEQELFEIEDRIDEAQSREGDSGVAIIAKEQGLADVFESDGYIKFIQALKNKYLSGYDDLYRHESQSGKYKDIIQAIESIDDLSKSTNRTSGILSQLAINDKDFARIQEVANILRNPNIFTPGGNKTLMNSLGLDESYLNKVLDITRQVTAQSSGFTPHDEAGNELSLLTYEQGAKALLDLAEKAQLTNSALDEQATIIERVVSLLGEYNLATKDAREANRNYLLTGSMPDNSVIRKHFTAAKTSEDEKAIWLTAAKVLHAIDSDTYSGDSDAKLISKIIARLEADGKLEVPETAYQNFNYKSGSKQVGLKYYNSQNEYHQFHNVNEEMVNYKDNVVEVVNANHKLSADAEITCAKATTAVNRFFDALSNNFERFVGFKDQILENVQNGIYQMSDSGYGNLLGDTFFGGGWSWEIEGLDDKRWYISLQQIDDEYADIAFKQAEISSNISSMNKYASDFISIFSDEPQKGIERLVNAYAYLEGTFGTLNDYSEALDKNLVRIQNDIYKMAESMGYVLNDDQKLSIQGILRGSASGEDANNILHQIIDVFDVNVNEFKNQIKSLPLDVFEENYINNLIGLIKQGSITSVDALSQVTHKLEEIGEMSGDAVDEVNSLFNKIEELESVADRFNNKKAVSKNSPIEEKYELYTDYVKLLTGLKELGSSKTPMNEQLYNKINWAYRGASMSAYNVFGKDFRDQIYNQTKESIHNGQSINLLSLNDFSSALETGSIVPKIENVNNALEETNALVIKLNENYKSMMNNWSHSDMGAALERDANTALQNFINKFDTSKMNDTQKEYIQQRIQDYAKLVEEQYNDLLYRSGSNPSSFFTGGSNFNVAKFNKKKEAEFKSQNGYDEKRQRFLENTEKKLKELIPLEEQLAEIRQNGTAYGESISADDPNALDKLKAKLEYLQRIHAEMVAANKEAGRGNEKPYKQYQLQNSNQQIKATEARIQQLETQAAKGIENVVTKFLGGEMVENALKNRLQLLFDEKPDDIMRGKLKSNGFKWAPSEGAWQRQLTGNAKYSAEKVLGNLLDASQVEDTNLALDAEQKAISNINNSYETLLSYQAKENASVEEQYQTYLKLYEIANAMTDIQAKIPDNTGKSEEAKTYMALLNKRSELRDFIQQFYHIKDVNFMDTGLKPHTLEEYKQKLVDIEKEYDVVREKLIKIFIDANTRTGNRNKEASNLLGLSEYTVSSIAGNMPYQLTKDDTSINQLMDIYKIISQLTGQDFISRMATASKLLSYYYEQIGMSAEEATKKVKEFQDAIGDGAGTFVSKLKVGADYGLSAIQLEMAKVMGYYLKSVSTAQKHVQTFIPQKDIINQYNALTDKLNEVSEYEVKSASNAEELYEQYTNLATVLQLIDKLMNIKDSTYMTSETLDPRVYEESKEALDMLNSVRSQILEKNEKYNLGSLFRYDGKTPGFDKEYFLEYFKDDFSADVEEAKRSLNELMDMWLALQNNNAGYGRNIVESMYQTSNGRSVQQLKEELENYYLGMNNIPKDQWWMTDAQQLWFVGIYDLLKQYKVKLKKAYTDLYNELKPLQEQLRAELTEGINFTPSDQFRNSRSRLKDLLDITLGDLKEYDIEKIRSLKEEIENVANDLMSSPEVASSNIYFPEILGDEIIRFKDLCDDAIASIVGPSLPSVDELNETMSTLSGSMQYVTESSGQLGMGLGEIAVDAEKTKASIETLTEAIEQIPGQIGLFDHLKEYTEAITALSSYDNYSKTRPEQGFWANLSNGNISQIATSNRANGIRQDVDKSLYNIGAHSHPQNIIAPSPQDIKSTFALAEEYSNYLGSLIIGFKEIGLFTTDEIDPNDFKEIYSTFKERLIEKTNTWKETTLKALEQDYTDNIDKMESSVKGTNFYEYLFNRIMRGIDTALNGTSAGRLQPLIEEVFNNQVKSLNNEAIINPQTISDIIVSYLQNVFSGSGISDTKLTKLYDDIYHEIMGAFDNKLRTTNEQDNFQLMIRNTLNDVLTSFGYEAQKIFKTISIDDYIKFVKQGDPLLKNYNNSQSTTSQKTNQFNNASSNIGNVENAEKLKDAVNGAADATDRLNKTEAQSDNSAYLTKKQIINQIKQALELTNKEAEKLFDTKYAGTDMNGIFKVNPDDLKAYIEAQKNLKDATDSSTESINKENEARSKTGSNDSGNNDYLNRAEAVKLLAKELDIATAKAEKLFNIKYNPNNDYTGTYKISRSDLNSYIDEKRIELAKEKAAELEAELQQIEQTLVGIIQKCSTVKTIPGLDKLINQAATLQTQLTNMSSVISKNLNAGSTISGFFTGINSEVNKVVSNLKNLQNMMEQVKYVKLNGGYYNSSGATNNTTNNSTNSTNSNYSGAASGAQDAISANENLNRAAQETAVGLDEEANALGEVYTEGEEAAEAKQDVYDANGNLLLSAEASARGLLEEAAGMSDVQEAADIMIEDVDDAGNVFRRVATNEDYQRLIRLARGFYELGEAWSADNATASQETDLNRVLDAYDQLKARLDSGVIGYEDLTRAQQRFVDTVESRSWDTYIAKQNKLLQEQYEKLNAMADSGNYGEKLTERFRSAAESIKQVLESFQDYDLIGMSERGDFVNRVSDIKEEVQNLLNEGTSNAVSSINAMRQKIDTMLTETFQANKISSFKDKVEELREKIEELANQPWVNSQTQQKELQELIARVNQFYSQASAYNKEKSGGWITVETISTQNGLKDALSNYLSTISAGDAKIGKFSKSNQQLSATYKAEGNILTTVQARINSVTGALEVQSTQGSKTAAFFRSYGQAIGQMFKQMSGMYGSYMILMRLISAFKEGVEYLKDYDEALTTISYTMDLTDSQLNSLGESARGMAEDLSISLEDAMDIYEIYANMQTSAEEIEDIGTPTAILSNLSGIDASTAADEIQSVVQAFDNLNNTSDDAMHIADVYDYISSQIAVDYSTGIQDMAEAVETVGIVAYQAGLSFEQLSAIVGKTAESTRQSGSTIANALKTIMVRTSKASTMSDDVDNSTLSNASKVLDKIGISVYESNGEYREFDTIMTELAEKWDTLTEAQQSNISYQIAATRQTSLFRSILMNWNDSMELATEATNANGNALKNQEKYEESYAGKLQELSNLAEEFWLKLLDSDLFNNLLDVAKSFLTVINKFPPAFAGLVLAATPLINMIKHGSLQAILGRPKCRVLYYNNFAEGIQKIA